MAIYHWESKVITRGEGRTACGAAAYMSCSRLYNDYDGIQHDYTRKGGLVWEHVFLPPMAPAEWNNRETLWNAVEANEKAKDSQLAREFIVALPVELDADAQIDLLTDFIQSNFVADGMCADVSLHNTDGHNPHAHILVTMRPLNGDGTWQYKTEKEYLCVRNGEERGFTAAEFKIAQAEGWEKQYQYYVTPKKKEYMTPSAAEARGLERASKYPKATKFGRQNPISARWNSEEELRRWRAAWADAVNRALERKGVEIGELEFSKNGIVSGFGKESDKEMPTVPKEIKAAKANVGKLDGLDARYTGEIEQSGREFDRLKEKSKQYDLFDLTDARLALRPQMEDEAKARIRKEIPDRKLSTWDYLLSAQETDRQFGEDSMERWLAVQKRRRRMEQAQREHGERDERQRKPKHRGMER